MNYGVGYGYPFDCIESITVADGRSTQLSAANDKPSESGSTGFKDWQDQAAPAPAHGEPVEPPNPANPQIPKIPILTTPYDDGVVKGRSE